MGRVLYLWWEKYVSVHNLSVSIMSVEFCLLSPESILHSALFCGLTDSCVCYLHPPGFSPQLMNRWKCLAKEHSVGDGLWCFSFLVWTMISSSDFPLPRLLSWTDCWCPCFSNSYSLPSLFSLVLRAVIASFISSSITDLACFLCFSFYFASSCPEHFLNWILISEWLTQPHDNIKKYTFDCSNSILFIKIRWRT